MDSDSHPWSRRFGLRNLAYLVFVLLIPFAEHLRNLWFPPKSYSGLGSTMEVVLLWATVSIPFFLVNALLGLIALYRGRPAAKSLIACALPFAVFGLILLLGQLGRVICMVHGL